MTSATAWVVRRGVLATLAALALGTATRWALSEAVTDYRWHANAAARLDAGDLPGAPHLLFQVLLVGLHRLAPSREWVDLAIDLTVLCQVALALLVASLLEDAWPRSLDWRAGALVSGLALALLAVGPVNLGSWSAHNLYLGYLSPTTHHNPTATLLRPLALAVWWRVGLRLFGSAPVSARSTLGDATLTLLSVLAKPSQALALAPATVLVAAWRVRSGKPVEVRALALGFVLPVLAALAGQYSQLTSAGEAGIAWAPLAVMSAFPGSIPGRLLLSTAFPLCVVALRSAVARRDGPLGLSWLSFAFGLVWVYGFTETGERQSNANLLWTGHITLFVLFFASARLLLRQPASAPWRDVVCWLALALHLAGGIALCLHPTWF